jgi:hypothetical protein
MGVMQLEGLQDDSTSGSGRIKWEICKTFGEIFTDNPTDQSIDKAIETHKHYCNIPEQASRQGLNYFLELRYNFLLYISSLEKFKLERYFSKQE